METKVSVLGDVARSCCEWLTGCRIGGNRWLEPVVGWCQCFLQQSTRDVGASSCGQEAFLSATAQGGRSKRQIHLVSCSAFGCCIVHFWLWHEGGPIQRPLAWHRLPSRFNEWLVVHGNGNANAGHGPDA